jgi:hypothetical protein
VHPPTAVFLLLDVSNATIMIRMSTATIQNIFDCIRVDRVDCAGVDKGGEGVVDGDDGVVLVGDVGAVGVVLVGDDGVVGVVI